MIESKSQGYMRRRCKLFLLAGFPCVAYKRIFSDAVQAVYEA